MKRLSTSLKINFSPATNEPSTEYFAIPLYDDKGNKQQRRKSVEMMN
jgi:hypothetical protein